MATNLNNMRSSRGRPSAARASTIDRSIIEAARRLFLDEGFDAVTMEKVVAAAGISKGTLYARHPSKEALFVAVVEASVLGWSEIASRDDHLLTADIEQRLRQHARTIARALEWPDVMAFQRLIFTVQERFPGIARAMHEAGSNYIIEFIARDIVNAAEADGIPARDPVSVARLLVSSLAGYQQQAAAGGASELGQLGQFAQRTVDLLMAARPQW